VVIWITGLSGSGKSTIGNLLLEKWRGTGAQVLLIDGDDVRHLFDHEKGAEPYTIEQRHLNAERIFKLCKLADDQSMNVACCALSLFEDIQKRCREEFSEYFEVFIDTPWQHLLERDPKGLYAKAEKGEVINAVGFDIPFDPPKNPDLIIENNQPLENLSLFADQILGQISGVKY